MSLGKVHFNLHFSAIIWLMTKRTEHENASPREIHIPTTIQRGKHNTRHWTSLSVLQEVPLKPLLGFKFYYPPPQKKNPTKTTKKQNTKKKFTFSLLVTPSVTSFYYIFFISTVNSQTIVMATAKAFDYPLMTCSSDFGGSDWTWLAKWFVAQSHLGSCTWKLVGKV